MAHQLKKGKKKNKKTIICKMLKIKNFKISNNSKIFTIAEIGINHNGSIKNAIKLINFAKEAGFSAVKFQTYDVDEMLKENTKLAHYQKQTKFSNMKSLLKKIV